jgi:serine/threonine protein kinase
MGAVRSDLHQAYVVSKDPIGTGGCASVYLGTQKSLESRSSSESKLVSVAIKVIAPDENRADISLLATQEASFLISVQQHPNIVGFYGIFSYQEEDGPRRWVMNMEWCSGGDLHDHLSSKGPLTEGHGAEVLFGILSALSHVHSRGIVHRDVKTENILMSECGRPVLTDFGIAGRLTDKVAMEKRCGSPGYAAPEVLVGNQYGVKVDVFGMGVLLYFCLSGFMPFAGADIAQIFRRTVRCRVRFESKRFLGLSVHIKRTISLLLQKDPSDRLSAEAALQHTWNFYAVYLREHAAWLAHAQPTPMEAALSIWSGKDEVVTVVKASDDE